MQIMDAIPMQFCSKNFFLLLRHVICLGKVHGDWVDCKCQRIGASLYQRGCNFAATLIKVEKILKGSLDLIPSPSEKIQTMGVKVSLRFKGKILLSIANKLLKTKSLLILPSNVLPYYLNFSKEWPKKTKSFQF